MSVIRWVLFIPAALAGGTVLAVLLTWATSRFPDIIMMMFRGCGETVGMMFFGMYVAPSKNQAAKWILVVVAAIIGLLDGLESLGGPKPIQSVVGFSMLLSTLGYVRVKPDEVLASVESGRPDAPVPPPATSLAAIEPLVQAIGRLTANLFEATRDATRPDHAPEGLNLDEAEAQYRHMCFCLATVMIFTSHHQRRDVLDAALHRTAKRVSELGTAGGVLPAGMPQDQAASFAETWTRDFAKRWLAYVQDFGSTETQPGELTDNVAAMLRRVEVGDNAPLGRYRLRLRPLARWLEEYIITIDSECEELTRQGVENSR